MNPIVHFVEKDNLATTLRFLAMGETIEADGQEIVIEEDIPQYHKVALAFIPKGEFAITKKILQKQRSAEFALLCFCYSNVMVKDALNSPPFSSLTLSSLWLKSPEKSS